MKKRKPMVNFFTGTGKLPRMNFLLSSTLFLWMLSALASSDSRAEVTDVIERICVTTTKIVHHRKFGERRILLIEGQASVPISTTMKMKISIVPTFEAAGPAPNISPCERLVSLSKKQNSFSETQILPFTSANVLFSIEIEQLNDSDASSESVKMFKSRVFGFDELKQGNILRLDNFLSAKANHDNAVALLGDYFKYAKLLYRSEHN